MQIYNMISNKINETWNVKILIKKKDHGYV